MEEIDYQSLTEEEKKAFKKMSDAYNACEDFEKRISRPNQGKLTDEQKQEEKRLNENYKNALKHFWDVYSKRKNSRNKK